MNEDVRTRRIGASGGGGGAGWTAAIAGAVLAGGPMLVVVARAGAGLVELIGAVLFVAVMAFLLGISVRAVVAWRREGADVPVLALLGLAAVAAIVAWVTWSLASLGG